MSFRSATALLLIASPGLLFAAPKTVTLDVPGMTCPTCPITIRKVLLKQAGVSGVAVRYKKKELDVTYDDTKVTVADILKSTAGVGFPASLHE